MRKNPRLLLQVIDNIQVYRELAARAKAAGSVTSEVAKSAEIAAERQIGLLYLNDLLYKYRTGLGDLTKAAREQYDTNKSKYERPERVNASHILIAPRGRTKEAAQKLAENLREQIAKGADLGALAKIHSDDQGTKDNGGVLGTFPRGTMIKPFDEAVFKLTQKGELAPIVESQFGYHVIQLNTRSAAGLATFEDVKGEIIDELANKAVSQYRDVILSGIRNDASMKINESAFESMTGARPTRRAATQEK
jgi:parvulin-like peptidyl-prolyl isomerase